MYKKLLLILLVSVFSAAGCQQNVKEEPVNDNRTADNYSTNAPADKAPDFTLTDINNKKVSLADFKGKIILVDFWATWCPPCRKGIPDLVELQTQYKDDFVVLGISLDRETKKDVVPFVKDYSINYPVLYGDQEVTEKFGGIQAIPTSFIIDKNGNIVDKHVGLVSKSVYENKIKQILGKS